MEPNDRRTDDPAAAAPDEPAGEPGALRAGDPLAAEAPTSADEDLPGAGDAATDPRDTARREDLPGAGDAPTLVGGTPRGEDVPGTGGPRRLLRPRDERMLFGVAGGLGRYFSIDPVIFRLAFVLLLFAGGAGLLVYVLAVILIPSDETTPRVPWRERSGGARGLVRAGAAILLAGLALLVACAVGVLAAIGGGPVIASLVIVAGLAMVALGLAGRGRWIAIPALMLAAPLAIVAAADIDVGGGVGDREYRPASAGQIADRYKLGMGDLVLDLRDVDLPAGRTPLTVDMGVGRTLVLVPEDVCVDSRVRIGAGHAVVLGRESSGLDVDIDWPAVAARRAVPRLAIDADIGAGELEVRRGDTFAGLPVTERGCGDRA